ncbi:WD40 repeat domain-containing protein [Streptomyces sp. NPDC002004]
MTAVEGRPHAVTGSDDGTVRTWDLTAGSQIAQPISAHEWGVNAVAVGIADGRRIIVTGGDDAALRLWDLATGEQVGRDVIFPWKVFAVTIASRGRIVVGFGHEVIALSATGEAPPLLGHMSAAE